MQNSSNRAVLVISGLLTLLVLGGATLGLAFMNGWLQVAPVTPAESRADAVTAVAQADATAPDRRQLEDAYRSLDEAYAQIRALQAAQSQAGDSGHREHESAEHRADRSRGHERREGGDAEDRRDGRSHHRDADND